MFIFKHFWVRVIDMLKKSYLIALLFKPTLIQGQYRN